VVATGGNRSQITSTRKRLKQGKTVAAGCDRLPQAAHGKEGVDGSSRQRASRKRLQIERLACLDGKRLSRAGTRGLSLMFPRCTHQRAELACLSRSELV
jgi:hypothetical protein